MITRAHILSAIVAGGLVCSAASAQTRGSAPGQAQPPAPAHSAPAPVRSAPRTPSAPMSRVSAPTHMARPPIVVQPAGGSTQFGIGPTGEFISADNAIPGVPGLGFDYPHLAAISGGRNGRPFSRFERHGHSSQGLFVPIFWGGYPYYFEDPGYDQEAVSQQAAPPAQPQIIVIQQPVPAQAQGQVSSQAVEPGSGSAAAAVPDNVPAPAEVPDVGDFILVRRDGRVLFASAYSVAGAQLHYVTPEGVRRTVAVAELDPEATEQMNEARGTSVQIHH